MNRIELAYRKSAVEAPSGLGLLIALFDTLANDLQRAAKAQCGNDIEARCAAIRHALLVVGHLEDWVTRGTGGTLADALTSFYSKLRRQLIEAQAKRSADLFEQAMACVLQLRTYWQSLETSTAASGPEILQPEHKVPHGYPEQAIEDRVSSWSA